MRSVPGPPRMSAQDRRQQLVDIGLDLLATRSIHELAMDEVAAEAGVSRTLVFHYFPSKGDYFAAVVSSAGARLMEAVPRDSDTDVQTRLRMMVTAFLKFVQRKRGAYVALVRDLGRALVHILVPEDGEAEGPDEWWKAERQNPRAAES